MTHTMFYKGYTASIEHDDNDGIFIGRLLGIQDDVSFHADRAEGLHNAFKEAVEEYIETCMILGKEPQKPVSLPDNIFDGEQETVDMVESRNKS